MGDRPTSGTWWLYEPAAPEYARRPFIGVFREDGTYRTPGDLRDFSLAPETVVLGEARPPRADATTDPADVGWRPGRKVHRTLYLDGQLVGLVDTGELASAICDAMNNSTALAREALRKFGTPSVDFDEAKMALHVTCPVCRRAWPSGGHP